MGSMRRSRTRKTYESRVQAKIMPVTECGCWLWTGRVNACGYGTVSAYEGDKMVTRRAHRVVYEHEVGKIPDGLVLDHKCRNPSCVNPAHLEPVTTKENTRRGLSGVLKTHCKHGHKLGGDNLADWAAARGIRACRVCRKEYAAGLWKRKVIAKQLGRD